jgi:hypothetical protein
MTARLSNQSGCFLFVAPLTVVCPKASIAVREVEVNFRPQLCIAPRADNNEQGVSDR